MADAMLDGLVKERDNLLGRIQALKDAATDAGRDISEDDMTAIGSAKERIAQIDRRLEVIGDELTMSDEVRNKLARVTKTVAPAPAYRSSGEVLYDLLHQSDEDSRARYSQALRRAAQHMGTDAATTVPTAGDLGGLVVDPVVGPVIDPYPKGMPLANAIGLIPAPNSLHFLRPRLVDPNFATGVGQQGSAGTLGFEKAELPSQKFDVAADPVALTTIGGYLNVSQQLISLQPGSLDLIISHLNRRLANKIDATIGAAVAATTATPITMPTDAATMQEALAQAVAQYYEATLTFPEWIAFGAEGYQLLAGLSDAAGRPMFPNLGPANANGSNDWSAGLSSVGGLTPVLTPGITTGIYIGGGDVIEGYLYRFPVLEAVEPSVLGRQVAVSAAVGTFTAEPFEAAIQVIETTDTP